MKKEQIFKLLNRGKRDHTDIKKPKKRVFTVELWNYTGKRVLKTIKRYMTGLNDNLSIVFKPVKTFTKKQLKGLDKYDLAEIDLKAEEEKRKRKEKLGRTMRPTSNKSVTSNDTSFDNWFGITGNKEGPVKKRITLKKEDGRVVGLDDYENNIFW
tara:strand:+ start:195 stop:659 length:465 start_codon:yes stop_codon:yes gene_type:complete